MATTKLMEELSSMIPELRMEEGHDDLFGNQGKVIICPKTEEEIVRVLTFANEQEKKVNIMGGGTKRGFGGMGPSSDILLSLSDYRGIVEHTIGDMTVTVKAGTNYKVLQDFLGDYQQKIPLDPFQPEFASIGGVISANDCGPKRFGYGSARDMVIGLKVIYPDGTVLRSGGKTVKNVAGYDMNKLFIGAMGTLGVLSEVTIKLKPQPKYESLVLISFKEANLHEIHSFIVNLLDSILEPVSLELLSPSLSENLTGQPVFTLAISFEDVQSSVHYQIGLVKRYLSLNAKLTVLEQMDARAFWKLFADIHPLCSGEDPLNETRSVLKIGVKNIDALKILKQSQLLQDTSLLTVEAHGGLGHGICKVYLKGASADVIRGIATLRTLAESLGGYAVVTHLPFNLRKQIEVWGEKPAHFFLLEGIKRKIDPKKILNHQRFVGGI